MRTALIGYTGFVGSNLASRFPFDDLYRSTNIEDIRGRSYDLVVSAGNRADSFRINQEPDVDRGEIDGLIDAVSDATIGKLVLVSTCVVYPGDTSPDETAAPTDDGLTPYGVNRLHQERAFADRFDTSIVRLPQLYGDGLKKGLVYDLANDYRVEFIRPDGRFQYYDARRLADDIQTVLREGIGALNVATPAISNATVAREVFGRDISAQTPAGEESPFSRMYTRDMRTVHAAAFGGSGDYLQTESEVLEGLRAFASEIGETTEATR